MKPRTKALAAGGVLAGVGLGGVLWYYLSGSLKIPDDIQAFQKESEEKFGKVEPNSSGEMPTKEVLDKMAENVGLDADDSVIVAFKDNSGMTSRTNLLRALQPPDSADPFQRKFSTFTYYSEKSELSVMPSISFRGNAQILKNSKYRIFLILPDKDGMRLIGIPPMASKQK